MSTRRDFLAQGTAAVVVATSIPVAQTTADTGAVSKASMASNTVARKSSPRIKSVIRHDETLLRYAGNGDGYHMSWAGDDSLYVSLCDGSGFSDDFKSSYNSRMFTIDGGPREATFHDLPGYPLLAYPVQKGTDPRYYGFGTLALDGRLYQFMSTLNHAITGDVLKEAAKISADRLRFIGAKLIYSSDSGRTWCNQDGSTPVVWEPWDRRSRGALVFFEESQEAFSLLSVLQMGRNYEGNQDGYVYIYSPNGNTDGTMNQLVMLRVQKNRILDRGAYEYFAGGRAEGRGTWSKDINARSVVHVFPRGWVNRTWDPFAWLPSITYNAPLGLYMMANWGTGSGPGVDQFSGNEMEGLWFAKPSYLGFWVAQNPWGPWEQIYEEAPWKPNNESAARPYSPQISPKWISKDGKSFWLVWSDFQVKGDKAEYMRLNNAITVEGSKDLSLVEQAQLDRNMRKFMPYYSFNVQRFDLITT